MNARSKGSVTAARLIVILLCVSFAPLVFGQVPPNRTQTKPQVNETRGVNRPQIFVPRPSTSTVPLLFGMNRNKVTQVLEPLHLQPKFLGLEDGIALAQDPAAGTSVPFGSSVVVTLGQMPELVLKGPAAPAYAGSALTFSVALVPPLPAGLKAIYHFTWGDGSPIESTGSAVVTHRFSDAGRRAVSVFWSLNDRVKIGSAGVVVDILPPPDTAQTYVPLLFGMNRVQVSRALEPLHLQPKFSGPDNGITVEQKPPAGTRVRSGSAIGVTLSEMPQLVLKGPAAPAYAGSALTFSVALVPPLPAGMKAIYHFTWGDGSPTESTGNAVVPHRFSDAGTHAVSVFWSLNDRVKIGSAGVVVDILPPPDTAQMYVPLLFGMTRVQVLRVLEPLHLQPKFSGPDNGITVEQKPPAGTRVRSGSAIGVTLSEMPRLVLKGPAAPAYAGSELTFSVAFTPPLPAGMKAIYHFTWGDGSPTESTGNAVVTHRFSDAGRRAVSVFWSLNDGVKIGSAGVVVDILSLPTPTPPSDTAQTATASDTSTTTATTTRVDTVSVTSDTTPSTPVDTTPTVTSTTETTGTVPSPDTSSNPLVWIGAAAVVLLLVVTFLLARVLRALNRKPQVQAKSPVAFNGGVRTIEYEIEHPELIRRGPAVGLRGGVRAEEGDDV